MAQGDKSNLIGVAYASVDKGKILGISLCIVPTPDWLNGVEFIQAFKR